jgi:CheY-like chemotaxis protein
MMGGNLVLATSSGRGSVFHFTLPMNGGDPSSQLQTRQPANLKGVRVLIVDDNETNRTILRQQVLSFGMQGECATNAVEALEMLDKASATGIPYGLAILDVLMPGTDGMELARAIRDNPAFASLPLIMLTSAGVGHDLKALQERGGIDCLTKPVRKAQLCTHIASMVQQSPGEIPAGKVRSPAGEKQPPAAKIRALLAEDMAVNKILAQHMLETLGCHVEAASNGQEAVDLLAKSSFDIIFMDCQMPVMDGCMATKTIREREAFEAKAAPGEQKEVRRIPIVALTAYAMQGDRERFIEAGMDDYVSKPYNMSALQTVLNRWVSSKQ